MITLRNIHKSFKGQKVLNGVNLDIADGHLTVVIGRSGTGKSVLLKHLIGLIEPDEGDICVGGVSLYASKQVRRELLSKFGILFQGVALFDSMSLRENVSFPLQEKTKLSKAEIKEETDYYLNAVGLHGMGDKYPSEVSGGMVKRAGLARAIINKPEVILFDEPTTGLDPVMEHSVHKLIRDTHDRFGLTTIIVSHSLPAVFDIAEDIAMLHEGEIVERGTHDDFLHSANPAVKQFLTGSLEGPIRLN